MLMSLLPLIFTAGTLGTSATGYANLYGCSIKLDTGPIAISTLKNTSNYGAPTQFRIISYIDCDCRQSLSQVDNTSYEYYIHLNKISTQVQLFDGTDWAIQHTIDGGYFNFESALIDDPNNSLMISVYSSNITSTNGRLNFNTQFYDVVTDESCFLYNYFTTPALGSAINVASPFNFEYKFDLDSLKNDVVNAINSGLGGYTTGYGNGYADGQAQGEEIGYGNGYSAGYTEGVATNGTAFTIFNGILGIGMLPINVFLAMLNWEVFGINISNFVMSIMTLAITIWVISTFTGKKEGKK